MNTLNYGIAQASERISFEDCYDQDENVPLFCLWCITFSLDLHLTYIKSMQILYYNLPDPLVFQHGLLWEECLCVCITQPQNISHTSMTFFWLFQDNINTFIHSYWSDTPATWCSCERWRWDFGLVTKGSMLLRCWMWQDINLSA